MSDAGTLVSGWVATAFDEVGKVFAANFEREDDFRETGAALAVFHNGKCVVDLYGGASAGRPWASDTLVNVWSATKGVAACAVARLVDQGQISYTDTVASVWPAFASAGKSRISIAEMMSHRAGLNGFEAPTSIEDLYDWDGCCSKLAAQAPVWPPGRSTSYHALTFGWLAGEVVRRVTGQSLGSYLRTEIAAPLGADVYIGLPEVLEARVATLSPPVQMPPLPDAPAVAFLALTNPIVDAGLPNTRAWRAAEIPAANGQASAMGLARLYAALAGGGSLGDVRMMSADGVARLGERAGPDQTDMLMGLTGVWGMGLMCNPSNVYGPGSRSFGHSGWGGSFGCADPDLNLSIGYVCGQMGSELIFDPRSTGLASAVDRCARALR